MGQNVYANFVYGFVVMDDEGENPAEQSPPSWLLENPDDEESEQIDVEFIASRLAGIEAPAEEFDQNNQDVCAKYETYWAAKRKAGKDSGVVLVSHCRSENDMWILGVTESHQHPCRGEVHRFGQRIEAKPEWRDVLKSFCDRAGIPFTEPEWLLAPYSE
jgi:hypothetical protein